MLPVFSVDDMRHLTGCDFEARTQLFLRYAAACKPSNLKNISSSELSATNRLSLHGCGAIARDHIMHVLELGSWVHMLRTATKRLVAMMIALFAGREWHAVVQFPGYLMRRSISSFNGNCPVFHATVLESSGSPQPTLAKFGAVIRNRPVSIDLSPKTLLNGNSANGIGTLPRTEASKTLRDLECFCQKFYAACVTNLTDILLMHSSVRRLYQLGALQWR